MNRVMHLLRGTVALRASGPFPERLMNLCALNRVDFWGVEWSGEHTLHFTIFRRDRARTQELAQRYGEVAGGDRVQIHIVPGAGHSAPCFKSEEACHAILDFIDSVREGGLGT